MKKPRLKRPPERVGRKRRAAGWTLLVLGVVVAGVWVASGWFAFGGRYGELWACCGSGEVFIYIDEGFYHDEDQWIVRSGPHYVQWHASGKRETGLPERISGYVFCYCQGTYEKVWAVVLWPIPLLLWTPAALLLRSGILARRRAMKGACPGCGYSLAGLGEGVSCPECGRGAATT